MSPAGSKIAEIYLSNCSLLVVGYLSLKAKKRKGHSVTRG
jgi:hypothetical protein